MNAGEAAMTFQSRWTRAVREHASAPFLLFRSTDGSTAHWSYEQFDGVVAKTAGTLRNLGVQPGSAVHMVLRNCPAFVAVWLAVARLGAWMVPADPASTSRDMGKQIRKTRPVVGLCAEERVQPYRDAACAQVSVILELTETAEDVAPGAPLLAGPPVADSGYSAAPADRLAVMFTSGTTSEPKGVVLTQHNYAQVADTMSLVVDLQPEHRWLVTLPLFHANAQYYCFGPAIAVGASVALTSAFSASRWLQQAHDLGVSHASLFAAPVRMILARRPSNPPPVTLTHVWFAQSLGADHYAEFARMVGCLPRQLYGMTETVAIVTADSSQPLRNDIIGRPIGARDVAVIDPESGRHSLPNEPGQILVRGTRGKDLFQGYLDDPETTTRSFEQQSSGTWFRTGDLATCDTAGTFRFVGRVDDVVKVAGENVSLTEIEAALAQAPGVLEVAVLARPDAIRGQVPVAYVVPRDPATPPNANDLAEWARVNLPPHAQPREWHLIDDLPRTSVGKVRRFRIGATRPNREST